MTSFGAELRLRTNPLHMATSATSLSILLTILADVLRSAVHSVGTRAGLGGLLTRVVALVQVAVLGVVLAGVRDLAGITVVGVDTTEDAAIDSDRVRDLDVPGAAILIAVTAAANKLYSRHRS